MPPRRQGGRGTPKRPKRGVTTRPRTRVRKRTTNPRAKRQDIDTKAAGRKRRRAR